MYSHLLPLFLALFSALQPTIAASASEWHGRSIYQVVTDRFGRTDNSVTAPCNVNDRVYCGGTWRGIINRLDYISSMGFSAIWISPIQAQIEGTTWEGEAYHGYWPTNLYALNPHFGGKQDLVDLIEECHRRGMLVMLDIPLNHMANQGETIKWSEFVPFNDARYFHPKCDIDWGNQTSMEVCWMGDGYVPLADVNTENPEVVATLEKYVSSLVNNYKFDGLRLDACRNIPKPFWTRITNAAGVYCQGEVWASDPEIIAPYQEHMDGLHNYPVKEVATTAFVSSSGNMSDLVRVAREMQSLCRVESFGSFMENHDNPRLGSFTTDISRLRNLAAFNILADGIPIVYYGQEQVFTGANDPANREALWFSQYSTTNNLVPTFTALNSFRNYVVGSGDPFLTTLAAYTLMSSSVISVWKGNVLFVLTNSGSGSITNVVLDGFNTKRLELVEILTCSELSADEKGQLTIVLRGDPMVLYPKSLLEGSGICGL
ncbi:glycoside hydrolase family 13 protein [Mycena galericulata]|nr:glycoside hydrolase family 13 protein [Mycena galericulata]